MPKNDKLFSNMEYCLNALVYNAKRIHFSETKDRLFVTAIPPQLDPVLIVFEKKTKVETVRIENTYEMTDNNHIKITILNTSDFDAVNDCLTEMLDSASYKNIQDEDGFTRLIPGITRLYGRSRYKDQIKRHMCEFCRTGTVTNNSKLKWNVHATSDDVDSDLIQSLITLVTLYTDRCDVQWVSGRYHYDASCEHYRATRIEFEMAQELEHISNEAGINMPKRYLANAAQDIQCILTFKRSNDKDAPISAPYTDDPFEY